MVGCKYYVKQMNEKILNVFAGPVVIHISRLYVIVSLNYKNPTQCMHSIETYKQVSIVYFSHS